MYCIRAPFVRATNQINRKTLLSNHQIAPVKFHLQSNELDESDAIVAEVCKENQHLEKRLKTLMLEVEMRRLYGAKAPDHLLAADWKRLLRVKTKRERNIYLVNLWRKQQLKEHHKAKKVAMRLAMTNPKDSKEFPDDNLYQLQHQSLFLRIRDQSINQFDNYRTLQALTFGVSLVMDCSYDENMEPRERIYAAKQLKDVFGYNRLHRNPFNMYMCNVNFDGHFMRQLSKNIPTLHEPWFPMNMHADSYLSLFPRERLVYLTPHCRHEMTHFDPDTVYIVGCMVDKASYEPFSLAKAKRDRIKMAKLPLDRYVEWGKGFKKSLDITDVVAILLDLKDTADWTYSLRRLQQRQQAANERTGTDKTDETELSNNGHKSTSSVNPQRRERFKRYLQDSEDV